MVLLNPTKSIDAQLFQYQLKELIKIGLNINEKSSVGIFSPKVYSLMAWEKIYHLFQTIVKNALMCTYIHVNYWLIFMYRFLKTSCQWEMERGKLNWQKSI